MKSRQPPPNPLPWLLGVVLALIVVILGACTRLSDAGLGCPDWPGCYGHVGVPGTAEAIDRANEAFAHRPVEPAKAWKEMVHRYAAGLLGLVVLGLALSAWRRGTGRLLATALLLLTAFQAALGMWTVTLQLKPVIVMGHLLGGFGVLSLLWLGYLGARSYVPDRRPPPLRLRRLALIGIAVLVAQIALGGWTASNYAATMCSGLPICDGPWRQVLDWKEAFTIHTYAGETFEFAPHLEPAAKLTIHVAHRIGAIVATGLLLLLALTLLARGGAGRYRRFAAAIGLVLAVQVALGVSNILFHLPLAVAVAHNFGALVLLQVVVVLIYSLVQERKPA